MPREALTVPVVLELRAARAVKALLAEPVLRAAPKDLAVLALPVVLVAKALLADKVPLAAPVGKAPPAAPVLRAALQALHLHLQGPKAPAALRDPTALLQHLVGQRALVV